MTVVLVCDECSFPIQGQFVKTERGQTHSDPKECDRLKAIEDNPFVKASRRLGQTVAEKNAAYGSSFMKCGTFLELLYPDGISPQQYGDMLLLVRIFDKQMRIATDKDALGEDPFSDIAGYGLLGMVKRA